MALARIKTWIAEVLSASDLNSEFNNILTHINNGVFWSNYASFSAYLSASTANNVTGDGTVYPVVCDTEEWDTLGNFAAGVFTAPVTGKYFFTFQGTVINVGAGHASAFMTLVTSDGRIFVGTVVSPAAIKETTSGTAEAGMTMTAMISLTAAQTVTPKIAVNGSTKTVGVSSLGSTGGDRATRFGGYLIVG